MINWTTRIWQPLLCLRLFSSPVGRSGPMFRKSPICYLYSVKHTFSIHHKIMELTSCSVWNLKDKTSLGYFSVA